MKKHLIGMAILGMATLAQAEERWALVMAGSDVNRAKFVELDSVARERPGQLTLWTLNIGRNAGDLSAGESTVRQARTKMQIDCTRRQWRALAGSTMNDAGNVLGSFHTPGNELEIEPGSLMARFADVACEPTFGMSAIKGVVVVAENDVRKYANRWFEFTAKQYPDAVSGK